MTSVWRLIAAAGLLATSLVLAPAPAETADFKYFRMYGGGSGIPGSGGPGQPQNPGYVVTPITNSSGTVGVAYSTQFSASGGTAPYTFATLSTLPPGLTLDGAGTLTGTPSNAGSYPGIIITATDAAGQTASTAPFQIIISNPISIAWAPADGRVGEVYVPTLPSPSGGRAPYLYSLTGQVPDGLTFSNQTGGLTGIPMVDGIYSIGITVIDTDGRVAQTGSQALTIAPGEIETPETPLALHGTPPADAEVGVGYLAHYTATGGVMPYTFALASGTLPDGLTLAADGTISGTPTSIGSSTEIVVAVTDATSTTVAGPAFSITVTEPAPLLIAGSPPSAARVGEFYSGSLTAFDGTGTGYVFTSVGSQLPPGLTLTTINGSDVQISGVPTSAGAYDGLQIKVADSAGHTALSQIFGITVTAPAYATADLSAGNNVVRSGHEFSGTLSTNIPEPIWTFVAAPTTPPLTIEAIETSFSGTAPTVTAQTTFQITAEAANDAMSASASPFSLQVIPTLTVSNGGSLFAGIVGVSISTPSATTAGTNIGQMNYTLLRNGAPVAIESVCQGLAFDPLQGSVSGTASASCAATNLTVNGTDAGDGAVASTADFSIIIDPAIVISGTPAAATVGTTYSFTPTVSGGSGNYPSFSIADTTGTLAALGLSFDAASGTISGTPSAPGTWTGTITVTDSRAHSKTSGSLSITAAALPLAFGGVPPRARQSEAYNFNLGSITRGGHGPYAYTILSGSLPAGLSLLGTNVVGTPSAPGNSAVSIRVTDANSSSITSTVLFTVDPAPTALYGTGYNPQGQVGDGTTQNRLTFVPVTAGTFSQIAAGGAAVCGINGSGGVLCWGYNWAGEFGNGSKGNSRTSPGQVPGLTSGATRIAVANGFACALVNGGVKCWGKNDQGQLGNGTFNENLLPGDVVGLTSGVVDISARMNASHACALLADGTVKCWGAGSLGQLGNGGNANSNLPILVPNLTGVTRIATGGNHTCAVTTGAIKCWGNNDQGQIGDSTLTRRFVPTQVTGLTSGATEISAGTYSSCAIVSGGARCWGSDPGNGSESANAPVNVTGMSSGVTAISNGSNHACTITGGRAYCWGANSLGRFGVGDTTNRSTPTQIQGSAPAGSLSRVEGGIFNTYVN